MKPRDIFGIIVRTLGLSLATYAIWYLVFGIATLAGLPEDLPGYGRASLITGVLFLAMGVYLLQGAPGLIDFAYPRNKGGEEAKPGEPNAGG